jgi:hypothetical protein
MEPSLFANVRLYNQKTMRDNRNIFIIPLSIALFFLITLDSFASADHDESIQESRKAYWFLTYFQQIKYFLVQVRGWERITLHQAHRMQNGLIAQS